MMGDKMPGIFGLGVYNIRRAVKKINENLKKGCIDRLDIQVLIRLLKNFKEKFDKLNIENTKGIKRYFRYFKRGLNYTIDWKDTEQLSDVSVHANKIVVMGRDVELNKIEDSIATYGGIEKLKADFSQLVSNLIDSLTAKLDDIKE